MSRRVFFCSREGVYAYCKHGFTFIDYDKDFIDLSSYKEYA